MKTPLTTFLLLPLAFSMAQARIYSTTFPANENPLSENNNWIGGGTTGLDWLDLFSTGGNAIGQNTIISKCAPNFWCDPTGIVAGSWNKDQEVEAVVYYNEANRPPSATTGIYQEVELRLRTSISAKKITGYEIDFWAFGPAATNPSLAIFKWPGPYQTTTFTELCHKPLDGTLAHNGDVLRATMIGSVITVYKNNVQVLQCTDTGAVGGPAYVSGSPGIGTDYTCLAPNVCTHYADMGFSSMTVRELYTLTLTKSGSGTITSVPAGINCGSACSAVLRSGASATLSATPAAGYAFAGWSGGGCSGTGTCTVVMSAAQSVTAAFTATTTGSPDVIVTALSYANGIFSCTVKNQGNAATPTGVQIGVGYSVDGPYKTYGMALGPLAAGASLNIGTTGASFFIANGTHTITAYADDALRFAESDENNNQLSQAITVGPPTLPADKMPPTKPHNLTTK